MDISALGGSFDSEVRRWVTRWAGEGLGNPERGPRDRSPGGVCRDSGRNNARSQRAVMRGEGDIPCEHHSCTSLSSTRLVEASVWPLFCGNLKPVCFLLALLRSSVAQTEHQRRAPYTHSPTQTFSFPRGCAFCLHFLSSDQA